MNRIEAEHSAAGCIVIAGKMCRCVARQADAIQVRLDNMNSYQPILHYDPPELYAAIREILGDEEFVLLGAIFHAENPHFLRSIKMPFLSDDAMREYGEYYRLIMRRLPFCSYHAMT